MDSDVEEKAEALKRALGDPPWLQSIGVGELGGDPAIFVYVSGRMPKGAIPEFWRGVSVWPRRVGNTRPAGDGP